MKGNHALFPGLIGWLALLGMAQLGMAQPAPGAGSVGQTSESAFIANCTKASKLAAKTKWKPGALVTGTGRDALYAMEPLTLSRTPLYQINQLKVAGTTPATHVMGIIERFTDDVEIPRITTACYEGTPDPSFNVNGDLKIPPGTVARSVTIIFRLQGLTHTTWIADAKDPTRANDSVRMSNSYKPNEKHRHPWNDDWPKGDWGAKDVKLTNNGTDVSFQMISIPTAQKLCYEFALVFRQTGSDNISIDMVIDPQIINHAVDTPGKP